MAFHQIRPQLRLLIEDAGYWLENGTFPPDEIAVRFHHRLVLIHPFPNGNGRHGRLAADLLAVRLGQARFTWGRVNLLEPEETRRRYIAALRAADAHDIRPLMRHNERRQTQIEAARSRVDELTGVTKRSRPGQVGTAASRSAGSPARPAPDSVLRRPE